VIVAGFGGRAAATAAAYADALAGAWGGGRIDALAAPADLRMLYVPFDTFEPFPDGQRYTMLTPRLFRYEACDRSFEAELPVDEDGIVTDYPTLFRRL